MNIIDAHTHLGYNDVINAPVERLVAELERAGIAQAVVLAGDLGSCPTEVLLKHLAPYTGRLFAVGSISPGSASMPSVAQVETWFAEGSICGLKFYPGYEYYYPADAVLRPYLDLLVRHHRPAIFHSGDTFSVAGNAKLKFAHPLHIDELAVDMPDLNIIIAHMGYPWTTDAGEVCYKNKNVYTDCSGFVYGTFDDKSSHDFALAAENFMRVAGGSEKILFGTDWSISDPTSYVTVAQRVFGADNTPVFSGNARRLFGL